MEVRLSVIIPVYNVEKYLDECLGSVIPQINESCEVILVDDGSTDSSGIICDSYRTSNICVVHKENGGLSSARNAGLEIAKGRYIAFVDSDDRIAEGAISTVLEWIETHSDDICFMNAIKFFPDGTEVSLGDGITVEGVEGKTSEEVLSYLATRPKFPGSSCTKIYSKVFLDRLGIRFPKDRRTSEDLWFVIECLINAMSFNYLDIPYYEYRQNREGSITNSVTENGVKSLYQFVDYYSHHLCTGRKPKNIKCQYAMSFVAYEYIQLITDASTLKSISATEQMKYLSEYKWTLKYGASTKLKICKVVTNILGVKLSSKLMGSYIRLRQG